MESALTLMSIIVPTECSSSGTRKARAVIADVANL
jgi:hypothetical protein